MAIDPATGKLLPFQILSTRKRKAESEADIKVCVCKQGMNVYLVGGRDLLYPVGETGRPLTRHKQ